MSCDGSSGWEASSLPPGMVRMSAFNLNTVFVTHFKQLIVVKLPYILRRMLFGQGPTVLGLRPVAALFIAACLTFIDWNRVIERNFNPSIQGSEGQEVQDVQAPQVGKITFHGNEHFHAIFLRAVMGTERGGQYDPPTLQDDLLRVRKFYFDRGFLETAARVEFSEEDSANNIVSLLITIDEGPPTIVHAVQLAGMLPPEFPAQPVSAKAFTHTGLAASLKGSFQRE